MSARWGRSLSQDRGRGRSTRSGDWARSAAQTRSTLNNKAASTSRAARRMEAKSAASSGGPFRAATTSARAAVSAVAATTTSAATQASLRVIKGTVYDGRRPSVLASLTFLALATTVRTSCQGTLLLRNTSVRAGAHRASGLLKKCDAWRFKVALSRAPAPARANFEAAFAAAPLASARAATSRPAKRRVILCVALTKGTASLGR